MKPNHRVLEAIRTILWCVVALSLIAAILWLLSAANGSPFATVDVFWICAASAVLLAVAAEVIAILSAIHDRLDDIHIAIQEQGTRQNAVDLLPPVASAPHRY